MKAEMPPGKYGMTHSQLFAGIPVLVTGANGFIGSHLSRCLVNLNAEVHIFVRDGSDRLRLRDIEDRVTVWHGDITRYSSAYNCLAGARPKIIFHLAAARDVTRDIRLLDPMFTINLTGTINLFRAVQEAGLSPNCIINTGSSEEYGPSAAPFMENQREMPVSPYSVSKVAATHLGQMLCRTSGLPVVTLRPFLAYGPGQDTDMFVPSLIRHCLEKKDFRMTAGDQTRDFVYIDDIIDAYLRAAFSSSAIGEVINIGSGIEYRIRDVAEQIVSKMESPVSLMIGALQKRVGEAEHFFCNNDKAQEILGWVPVVSLDKGLDRTISWYHNSFSGAYPLK